MTKKRLFGPQSDSKVTFGGSKSLLLVTFESLCRERIKSLFSLF